jgi:hypothetical protein
MVGKKELRLFLAADRSLCASQETIEGKLQREGAHKAGPPANNSTRIPLITGPFHCIYILYS